jgi:hypothetical protein
MHLWPCQVSRTAPCDRSSAFTNAWRRHTHHMLVCICKIHMILRFLRSKIRIKSGAKQRFGVCHVSMLLGPADAGRDRSDPKQTCVVNYDQLKFDCLNSECTSSMPRAIPQQIAGPMKSYHVALLVTHNPIRCRSLYQANDTSKNQEPPRIIASVIAALDAAWAL